ncbi:MAG: hypothetical protein Q9182_006007 [Xanthomendoza sp. 2 TL-2023]
MNGKLHLALLALAAHLLNASPIASYSQALHVITRTIDSATITIEPTHTVTSTVPGTTLTQTIQSAPSQAPHTVTVTSTSTTTTTSTPSTSASATATAIPTTSPLTLPNPLPTTWPNPLPATLATLSRRQFLSDPPTREELEEYVLGQYKLERFNSID